MGNFSSLHLHTHYSPIDSVATIDEYLKRAVEVNIESVAVSDHGTMANIRENHRASQKHGIKVAQAIEFYLSPTDRFDRRSNKIKAEAGDLATPYHHLIAIAKNDNGLRNINQMNQAAWTEGYYNKPRIDRELFLKHHEDIVVLSGCMSGPIAKNLLDGRLEAAQEWAFWFKELMGEDFYVELQSENSPELNKHLLMVADEFTIKPVLTEDSHMVRPDDRELEEAFLILSTKPKKDTSVELASLSGMSIMDKFNKLYPGRSMTFENLDLFMGGREFREQKMKEQGIDRPELFDNTLEIDAKIGEYTYHKGLDLLPKPKDEDPLTKLKLLCRRGMKQKGLIGNQEYEDRLKAELAVIEVKNYAPYFIITADMMRWITEQGMQRGFCRGSAGGSLVCYLTGITLIDPIEYGLLFERFLDPWRDDPPDVDNDTDEQARVLQYLKDSYGYVGNITTVNYFQEKSSLKDAASILAVPFQEANKALKLVENFDEYLSEPELAGFRKKYPDVITIARGFNGKIRGYGKHAAGIVVSSQDFTKYMPMETRPLPKDEGDGRTPVVAYDGDELAELGAIKIDVLGVKTLSVVGNAIKLINKRHMKNITMVGIPRDDPDVFADISAGFTKGLFQAEQSASTKLILEMGVESFNDLVVSNALVRTGAYKAFGTEYIRRKRGKSKVKKIHPIYDEITKDTLGLPLYQESWMKIMNEFAGLDMGTVNKIRKSTAKKKDASELEPYKVRFIEGIMVHSDQETANFLWEWLLKTSEYGFNLSHSVGYSALTNVTAWLKHYYPLEFMVALLNNEKDKDSLTDYLIECKRLGLVIKLPHINHSDVEAKIEDGGIRLGLSGIKYGSKASAAKILAHAPYNSYADFYATSTAKLSGINSRLIGALNKVGAATFEDNPKRGDEREHLYEYLQIPAFGTVGLHPKIVNQFVGIEDHEGLSVFRALVRKMTKKDNWMRADLVDATGSIGLFTNVALEEGQTYAIVASGSNIIMAVNEQDIVNKVNGPLVGYLNRESYEFGHPKAMKVLSFEAKKTKAGKNMASVLLTDKDKNLKSAMIFDSNFSRCKVVMPLGSEVIVDFGVMKDGTAVVQDVRAVQV